MARAVLIDSSVWVDFLKKGNIMLEYLLRKKSGAVVSHEMVIGEVALCVGGDSGRASLEHLRRLYQLETVTLDGYLAFIESAGLRGFGLGFGRFGGEQRGLRGMREHRQHHRQQYQCPQPGPQPA